MAVFDLEGNQLVPLGGGEHKNATVWTLDGSLKYPVGSFPVRMAVVKLTTTNRTGSDNDRLLIWSPLPVPNEIIQQIESLGTVSYIVAPNSLHWMGVMPFAQACSNTDDIQICVAPGLTQKQEVLDAGLKWDYVLHETENGDYSSIIPPEWKNKILIKYIPGIPSLEEVILYDVSSKTLLVCDMAFHFQRNNTKVNVGGFIIPFYLKCCDGYRPCCLTRTFKWLISDVDACYKAMNGILQEFDFESIVMAHGVIITKDAKTKLREGTVSLLKEWRDAAASRQDVSSKKATTILLAALAVSVGLTFVFRRRLGGSNMKR